MPYDESHRFLLRLLASQNVLPLKETENLVKENTGNENVHIRSMIKEINEKIKPFHQMINIAKDEVTAEELVVFISYGYDDTTKAQNVFSALDLEFYRLLIDNIMTTETREITEISAINLANRVKVNHRLLTKIHAKELLDLWCKMHYLKKENNNYVLGVRAIHEFESYLIKNMPEIIQKCTSCKKIVVRGYNCVGCAKAIHVRCLNVCLNQAKKWPCCQMVFNESQLDKLRCQSSRLNQTLESNTTQLTQSTEMTVMDVDNEEETEHASLNTSQTSRKRKRQENA